MKKAITLLLNLAITATILTTAPFIESAAATPPAADAPVQTSERSGVIAPCSFPTCPFHKQWRNTAHRVVDPVTGRVTLIERSAAKRGPTGELLGGACIAMKSRTVSSFFEVTLNPNGGTISETLMQTNSVDRLSASGTPTPTREGHTFDGWYTEATGGTLVRTGGFDGTVFTQSMTIHARWLANNATGGTFTVILDLQGGSIGTASTTVQTHTNGRLSASGTPVPTRSGHVFEGWYTAATGGTLITTGGVDGTVFTADATIYARWRVVEATPAVVTFDPRSGTVTPTTMTTGAGNVLASLPTPTREGFNFVGWFSMPSGGTRVVAGSGGTVFNNATTVYAQWAEQNAGAITVTLNLHGGTLPPPATGALPVGTNGRVASLPTPSRTDHEFLGWFSGPRGGTRVTVEDVYHANTTIHARWKPINLISTGDFPEFHITTSGSVAPFTQRTTWIDSTFAMRGAGNTDFNFEGAKGDIRGRGRSSWDFSEKRSLRVRFDDRQTMLDSGYMNRRWVLISNHFDHSMIRNYTMYHFAAQLGGMDWVPMHRFVHLHVNGSYHGVYLLTDERRVEPGRVEITADPDPRVSEYFIEMEHRLFEDSGRPALADEWRHGYVRVNSLLPQGQFTGGSGTPGGGSAGRPPDRLYEVRFPDDEVITQAHFQYVQRFLDNVGREIISRDWNRIRAVIDVDSMIDFMIVQELSMNADVSHASQFMTIQGQGADRKLHMGLVWDFDLGMLNHSWMWDRGFFNPYGEFITGEHFWYENLMAVPQFREAMRVRWNTVATPALANTIAHTRQYTTTYRSAFERNFTRWNVLGQPTWIMSGGFGGGGTMTPRAMIDIRTYQGHIDYVLNFLTERGRWLAEDINGRDSLGGRKIIRYDANLGSSFGVTVSNMPPGTLTDTNGRITETLPTPTRSGGWGGAQPTFQGWFTAATGGTRVSSTTVFTEHSTIYARWQ